MRNQWMIGSKDRIIRLTPVFSQDGKVPLIEKEFRVRDLALLGETKEHVSEGADP